VLQFSSRFGTMYSHRSAGAFSPLFSSFSLTEQMASIGICKWRLLAGWDFVDGLSIVRMHAENGIFGVRWASSVSKC